MLQGLLRKPGRLLAGGAFLLTVVIAGVWLLRQPPTAAPDQELQPTVTAAAYDGRRDDRATIADVWGLLQPASQPAASTPAPSTVANRRFNEDGVAEALGRVVLDHRGRIVLDRNALAALENAFDTLEGELSDDDLAALQDFIRAHLPGTAGEQTAQVVGDYYRYRRALEAFERQHPEPADAAAALARLEQLRALRESHFGPATAAKFFAEEQAFARYLLERQRLLTDDTLSPQERSAQEARLQRQLEDGLLFLNDPDSPQAQRLSEQLRRLREQGASAAYLDYVRARNLGLATAAKLAADDSAREELAQRIARFEQEQSYILEAALTEEERKAQLEALLEQTFNDAELEAIRAYGFD